jgi:WD40 repeat protein/serine/threonine protein kinase
MTEETLFAAALEKPPGADRRAFLDAACGDDLRLRERVEKLLAVDEESRGILDQGLSDELTGAFAPDGPDAGIGTVIGSYKLVEVIGEGGMGTVWLAQQSQPMKRLVALKVIKAGMDSRQVVARFEAERQALALMDHPNIAKVLDGGVTPDGRPYFVMELVKGVPITKFCDEHRLTPKQRLELFVPICQAIQHAHQKGIIHRDIKPSNVLVAPYDGKPVPKVIDFGVAKAAGQPLTDKTLVTGFGMVVGTPEYMSPEQAELNNQDIDTRSDIYSLGVLLYELLTGTTPIERGRFKKAAILEMLRLVREEEAPRLSTRLSSTEGRASIAAVRGTEPTRLAKDFRGELDWIAMKALEKDRTRRYETANALARDVQRFLADEIVEARPPSLRYRARKFVRRHKVRVLAGSLILLALVGGLIGTVFGVMEGKNQRVANALRGQAERDRDSAEKARDGEQQARASAESAQKEAETARDGEKTARAEVFREKEKLAAFEYGRTMRVVLQECGDNNILAARGLLDGTRKDLRGWEWDYLHRLCHADLLTLRHGGSVKSAVFSPDGSRVLTACRDQTAQVWNARTGKRVSLQLRHSLPQAPVVTRDDVSAAFSPDGLQVVTTKVGITAWVWDTETGTQRHVLTGHTDRVNSVAYNSNGTQIVTGSDDRTARVWDAKTGGNVHVLKGHTARLNSAVFSPDGSQVVTASDDGTPRVWDTKTGKELHILTGHKFSVKSAVFSPDGSLVVTVGADNTARVWDMRTGTARHVLKGHTSHVHSAEFSPDGAWVVTASGDGTARLWDVKSGDERRAFKGHTAEISTATFSPDGARIVTASHDMTARVWDTATGDPLLVLRGHTAWVSTATFSPDGSQVVTASEDETARVWDFKTGTELIPLKKRDSQMIVSAAFCPDGPRVVTGHFVHNTAHVWDVKTGTELLTLKEEAGRRVLTSAFSGHTGQILSAAFSPDGTQLVTGSADNTARLWDIKTKRQLHVFKEHTGFVHSVAFSSDGTRVVTGSQDNTARVWNSMTGEHLLLIKGHEDFIRAVAFSPDGTRIVTGSQDKTARVWDATTGAQVAVLNGHTSAVKAVAFSSDSVWVATSSYDGTARVWDAKTGDKLHILMGHTSFVHSAVFSPDGTRIVTSSYDGTARLWDTKTGAEFLTFREHVSRLGLATALFSPDGSQILTAGHAGPMRSGTIAIAIISDARPVNREFLPREVKPPPPKTKP